jgi:ABC-type Fe3+-hydroxamate transport system substrate-binding protein
LKKSRADLAERTKGIADSAQPRVYVGALGMKGSQGIESTQAKYPPFVYIGARNVVDETGKNGSLMIEREKLVSWDPDKKSEEIYSFLFGKPVYEQMAKDYGGFKKLDLTQP